MFFNLELLKNILQSWGLTFLLVNFFYLFFLSSKKISVIDLFWGPLHLFQLVFCFVVLENLPSGTALIFLGVVFIWAARLSIYLGVRSNGAPDDPRYLELAQHWKGNFNLNVLIRIFYAQFIISLITSLSITLIAFDPSLLKLNLSSIIGLIVAVIGLTYESIADYQLLCFKRRVDKTKKVMNEGLWKFSRHPNYFGEIIFWWGIWFVSIQTSYWFIGIISPLTITYLLTRFSGVPMLEKRHQDNPEYLEYIRTTNTLLPGLKRK